MPGRHQRMRSARFRRLLTAGLIDSFGMTFGWTVFCLHVLKTAGLAGVGACNAAMLVGWALSAPVTAWLSPRMGAAALLRGTSAVEGALRAGSFALLLAGAPVAALATVIVVMYTAGLTAYAGMRAEVSACSRPGRAATMTLFVVAVLAVDAGGVATAALLPGEPDGRLLAAVVAVYATSALSTRLAASGARVGRAPRRVRGRRVPRTWPALLAGALIMLVGSGPSLLAVGLAAEMYGPRWVAGSALAFTGGTLLAPWAVALIERQRLPTSVTWPAWGSGMLIGWVLAPSHVAGLLVAQALSGLCIAAFQGGMDAHVALRQAHGRLMGSLATSEAVRAIGSAAAVAALPVLVGTGSLASFSLVASASLVAAPLLGLIVRSGARLAAWPPPARPPALAAAWAGPGADPARSRWPAAAPTVYWRSTGPPPPLLAEPEPPDEWARMLKRRRHRYGRRRPLGRWAAGAVVLVLVGAVMFEVGQAVGPARGQATALPNQATREAAVTGSTPPSRAASPAPRRPRVLALVVRDVGTGADPRRVFLVPRQVSAEQARRGKRPRFAVRTGEPLQVRVDNQDRHLHSFTLLEAGVDLDARAGTRSEERRVGKGWRSPCAEGARN